MSSVVRSSQDPAVYVYGVNSALVFVSAAILASRLYSRTFVVRALGYDDAMAVVAFVFCVIQSSLDMYMVSLGSGQHIEFVDPNDLIRFFNFLPIALMVLFWSFLFMRLTCVFFLPRLSQEATYLRLVYAVGGIVVVNTIVCFFLVLNECSPISDLWDAAKATRNCRPKTYETHITWSSASVGVFVDLCIMCLPIWIILKNLRFSRAKAIQVSMVFCVGFFSILCGCIRLGLILTIDLATDITFKFPRIAAWTEAELHVGFWVACAPAVKPLLRLASYKLGLRTTPDSTRHYPGSNSKYRVPSRASSPHGFRESRAGGTSFGGAKNNHGLESKTSNTQVDIELAEFNDQRGRTRFE